METPLILSQTQEILTAVFWHRWMVEAPSPARALWRCSHASRVQARRVLE